MGLNRSTNSETVRTKLASLTIYNTHMYTHVTHVPKPMSIFPSSPSHSPSLSLGKKIRHSLGVGSLLFEVLTGTACGRCPAPKPCRSVTWRSRPTAFSADRPRTAQFGLVPLESSIFLSSSSSLLFCGKTQQWQQNDNTTWRVSGLAKAVQWISPPRKPFLDIVGQAGIRGIGHGL